MPDVKSVAVVGAGSWGTAMAAVTATNVPTRLWARRPELADAITERHENPDYLPGIALPSSIHASADLAGVIEGADAVLVAVPSHGFRSVLEEMRGRLAPGVPMLSLTKGIEEKTLMRMTEVIHDVLPDHDRAVVGVLSGPNLAREIAIGQPAATVVALSDEAAAVALQGAFMTPTFRVYTNPDVVGCELAGACKNVMALASGMVAGLGLGDNTRAALVTRALAELARLGIAAGGNPFTFGGLAGVGDLVATCYSTQSRNFTVGEALGKGRPLDEIIGEMQMVAEGVKSTRGVLALAERYAVEMPIATEVGRVLYDGASPLDSMRSLMTRAATSEGRGIFGG